MKKRLFLCMMAAMLVLLTACGTVIVNPYEDIPKPVATITMEDGSVMRFTLDPASAPNTCSNFITLANSGYYDGMKFDYVYPTYFIRGGDPLGDGTGGPDYTIAGEFKENGFAFNNLRHTRGTISMCRLPEDNNSAGSQFFIMLSSHSEYNGQYAAFGYIEPNDVASFKVLDNLTSAVLDNSYRPLLRETILTIRVDTKGYVYEVVKYGAETPESAQTK